MCVCASTRLMPRQCIQCCNCCGGSKLEFWTYLKQVGIEEINETYPKHVGMDKLNETYPKQAGIDKLNKTYPKRFVSIS